MYKVKSSHAILFHAILCCTTVYYTILCCAPRPLELEVQGDAARRPFGGEARGHHACVSERGGGRVPRRKRREGPPGGGSAKSGAARAHGPSRRRRVSVWRSELPSSGKTKSPKNSQHQVEADGAKRLQEP